MFEQAGGYVILLSHDYQSLKKHYIWNKEIPIMLKKLKEHKVFTYCLPVAPVKAYDTIKHLNIFKGGKDFLPESGHLRDQYLMDFATAVIEQKFLRPLQDSHDETKKLKKYT